jgi:phage terminase large subunit-like protein
LTRRKTLAELKATGTLAHMTQAEVSRRVAEETPPDSFGLPAKPVGMDQNWRRAWRKWAGCLIARRVLARNDGPLLNKLVDADLLGDHPAMQRLLLDNWAHREPFKENGETEAIPEPAGNTLDDFLASVQRERASFASRLQPRQTVTLDSNGKLYEWAEGDAAAIARRYALDVVEGRIISGELLKRAAQRFLSDLESGCARGLFFDPIAARHICEFAERFCGLQLMPWEIFLFCNVYGWKRATGYRRFTEVLVSVAKKNGKTCVGAIVGLWGLIADGEKFADVFCSATKKEQARLVFRDAKRMVSANEELRDHVKRFSGALTAFDGENTMQPLSSDIKSMDGTRGSTLIMDELHMWQDRDQYDKVQKGGVSRTQPLCFAITTAGESKNCFCWIKFDIGEKILRGIIQNADETFILIYAIDKGDDYHNSDIWFKANPSLGVTLKLEHLQKTLADVEQDPSGLNAFLRYHQNLWPEKSLQRQGSISAAKWAACAGLDLIGEQAPYDATIKFMKMNKDTRCFAGLDIGLSQDLTAVTLLWPRARFEEGSEYLQDKKVIIVQFFMPEENLLTKEKGWGVPLSGWVREKWIELLPGDMVDTRLVKKFILELASTFNVVELGYDPWHASTLAAEISETNYVSCVAVQQTSKQLTGPIHEFLGAINRQEIVHFSNPVMVWMAGNVILAEDEQKRAGIKPERLSRDEKIDGIASTLNAWDRMLAAPPPSVYLNRGLVLLGNSV